MYSLRAAAFDLANQNLIQEGMEHHIAKMDWKRRKKVSDEQAREGRLLWGSPSFPVLTALASPLTRRPCSYPPESAGHSIRSPPWVQTHQRSWRDPHPVPCKATAQPP